VTVAEGSDHGIRVFDSITIRFYTLIHKKSQSRRFHRLFSCCFTVFSWFGPTDVTQSLWLGCKVPNAKGMDGDRLRSQEVNCVRVYNSHRKNGMESAISQAFESQDWLDLLLFQFKIIKSARNNPNVFIARIQ